MGMKVEHPISRSPAVWRHFSTGKKVESEYRVPRAPRALWKARMLA